ncbi:hypothetical protein VMUT_0952 [Vulcanisaeta moutnovskia 768-28]|uniref:Uncharacterized protein n=1 Tax=Vulcanisaeta moutnovskia (strain 768-28) TaxID=985053 RepID=F0QXC3_VULM7|nr:hypothetical protein VMUT_0952 [Vulcanisaeta moutnovskia 768-28]
MQKGRCNEARNLNVVANVPAVNILILKNSSLNMSDQGDQVITHQNL